MELASIQHIDPSQVSDFKADVYITTLGYETRGTLVSTYFENLSCRKVALTTEQCPNVFSYEANKAYFLETGFELITVEGDVPDVEALLGGLTAREPGVVVDCTSMPVSWYYQFFKWYDDRQVVSGLVRMRIVYTMADFVDLDKNLKVKELSQFLPAESKNSMDRKKALLLGLGQEKYIGEAIVKIVQPDKLFLYYADPPVDKKFVELTFVNNHKLISTIPIKNLISYPIRNGQVIYQSLIDTILTLRNDHSIILIPHGPKIFSVVAMLIHLGYPDVRISYPSFKKPQLEDRSPSGVPVVLDVVFEGEE